MNEGQVHVRIKHAVEYSKPAVKHIYILIELGAVHCQERYL